MHGLLYVVNQRFQSSEEISEGLVEALKIAVVVEQFLLLTGPIIGKLDGSHGPAQVYSVLVELESKLVS